MKESLAQDIRLLPQGQFTPLTEISIGGLINAAVNLVLVVASILFFFSFVIGGIKLILSGGKQERIDAAKNQLLSAFIGVFIVFATWGILGFAEQFFGINLLTFEIPAL